MISVDVDASSFFDWAEQSMSHIKEMIKVLEDIKVIIWQHTMENIPLEKGFLESSFFEYGEMVSEYPFFELHITITGIDNPDANGWDYALYQHSNNLNHPIKGQEFFLEVGFEEAEPYFMKYLETDYLTALGV